MSPDSLLLASCSADATIRVWHMSGSAQEQPNCLKTFRGHDGAVSAVEFSADSSRLFSCGRDGVLRMWDVAAGLKRVPSAAAASSSISTHTGTSVFATSATDGAGGAALWARCLCLVSVFPVPFFPFYPNTESLCFARALCLAYFQPVFAQARPLFLSCFLAFSDSKRRGPGARGCWEWRRGPEAARRRGQKPRCDVRSYACG